MNDTYFPSNFVAGKKSTDIETFGTDIIKKFAETSVSIEDIRKNDGQITFPLTDEVNQSSMKKVSEPVLNSD